MNERIRPHHLSRKAMLYVRQSSPTQVMRNAESRRLQYGMTKKLQELGWGEVEVVDEDLGKNAEGYVERAGFERMVAQVSLGKVGVVAARELSRLARNSGEWQKLIEVCRIVGVLLLDQETVYDARRGNDRLLLGLKGSLNEYELDILRLRSVEARYEKARRGELVVQAPVGYIKTEDGRLEKDPDRRVQEVIELLFRKALETGAARQVLVWLLEHGVDIPGRKHGPLGLETVWKRPTYAAVARILGNPVYAGFYAFGKTETTVEFRDGKPTKRYRRKRMDEWLSLLPDRHEGYIGATEFKRIREMMAKNAQAFWGSSPGAPKKGPALLAGLLRCRRCGGKLTVAYTGSGRSVQRYCCQRGQLDQAEPRCISISGFDADDAVSQEVLRVVQPGAVDAAVCAAREAAERHDDVLRALELDLQAAQYAAEKAWKQYDATDPANRLVAGELESRWNATLHRVREIEQRIEDEKTSRNATTPPTPEAFRDLARDLGRVWDDPQTDVRLKKRILRTLIEEVLVEVNAAAGEVELVIHWKGGVHTALRIRRRRRGETRQSAPKDTVESVRALALILPDDVIAGYLNRNGLRTGKGNRWVRERVTSLRGTHGIPCYSSKLRQSEGWMTLSDAAKHLGLCMSTLSQAAQRGKVRAMHPLPQGPWIFRRQDLEEPGARELVKRIQLFRNRGAAQDPAQLSLFSSST